MKNRKNENRNIIYPYLLDDEITFLFNNIKTKNMPKFLSKDIFGLFYHLKPKFMEISSMETWIKSLLPVNTFLVKKWTINNKEISLYFAKPIIEALDELFTKEEWEDVLKPNNEKEKEEKSNESKEKEEKDSKSEELNKKLEDEIEGDENNSDDLSNRNLECNCDNGSESQDGIPSNSGTDGDNLDNSEGLNEKNDSNTKNDQLNDLSNNIEKISNKINESLSESLNKPSLEEEIKDYIENNNVNNIIDKMINFQKTIPRDIGGINFIFDNNPRPLNIKKIWNHSNNVKKNMQKFIFSIAKRIREAGLPEDKNYFQDIENIDGIVDLINPENSLIPENVLDTIFLTKDKKNIKFDLYLDFSSSMQSNDVNIKGINFERFTICLMLAQKLIDLKLINKIYAFGNNIHPVHHKVIQYIDPNQGTEALELSILKAKEENAHALIITDAQSLIYTYYENVWILVMQSYYDKMNPIVQKYLNNDRIIQWVNGKFIKPLN